MKLQDVTDHTQFDGYYKQEGLNTVESKIEHLSQKMGVTSVICSSGCNTDNVLAALEDNVLVGSWIPMHDEVKSLLDASLN